MEAAGVVGNDSERQFAVQLDGGLEEDGEVALGDFENLALFSRKVAEEEQVDRGEFGAAAFGF